ncbi:hypothetical protein [Pseudomonas phoenicis]|uniref:hypothetical protein n=1 Tax=unclassified Pseudomonas TaxID=196821 RepID=UPI0039A2A5D8
MRKRLLVLLGLAFIAGCNGARPYIEVPRTASDNELATLRCIALTNDLPVPTQAIAYLEAQTLAGNPGCMTMLGTLYFKGERYGVAQDLHKARELFQTAAPRNPLAYVFLGWMAEQGLAEPMDLRKARLFYRLAKEAGAVELGRLLEQGKGGAKDPAAAMRLYIGAIRRFDDLAWNAVARLHAQGQTLDNAQRQRYQYLWVRATHGQMSPRLKSLPVLAVREAAMAAGPVNDATLRMVFSAGSQVPKISIARSSGNAELDAAVIAAMARFSMKGFEPLIDESGQVEVLAPLVFVDPAKASYAPEPAVIPSSVTDTAASL